MKKIVSLIVVIIMTLSVAMTTCAETMDVVNCQQSVTLRTSPSVNTEELIQVPLGAQVESIGWDNSFNQVIYNGLVGWILTDYLALNPCIGRFYKSIEPNGRYWFGHTLTINSISDGIVYFDFDYQKPGHSVTYNSSIAEFVSPNTAIGYGSWNFSDEAYGTGGPVKYVMVFWGNCIEVKTYIGDNSEAGYDIYFDLYNDRI